ncbi:Ankyrin repeat protein [Pyrenophora tritici-repentis]|nr:Ankyrin repeat protein [Pyrenophora tritici-repentis]
MTKDAESLLTIRKEDFEFLMQHCCNCSGLSDNDRVTVENIQAAIGKTVRGCDAAWKRAKMVKEFLHCVGQWSSAQLTIFKDNKEYEQMIRAFTESHTSISRSRNVQRFTGKSLVDVGLNLAKLVTCSLDAYMLQKSFSHFQSLLLLSYCVYLEKKGISTEDIDSIIQIVVTARNETKRKRLLVQAKKINKIIAELGKIEGWNIVRATELFLICPLSIYTLLNISSTDFRAIEQSVAATTPDFTGCFTPSYTIPGLIERLIQQSGVAEHDSVKIIGEYLGYDQSTISETSENIYQVHSAAPLPVTFHNTFSEQSNVTPNSAEMVRIGLQQTPSSEQLDIVHENILALDIRPRKRRRLNWRTTEEQASDKLPSPCNAEQQIISSEVLPQIHGTASTSLIIPDQSIISTPVTSQNLRYPALNHINYELLEQSPNELSTWLPLEHGNQQCKELVPYTVSATLLTSALESPIFEGCIGNPRPQLQLWTQREVPDTARSIWFAINGNIDGLKYLFRRGLASPRDWALYGGMCNYETVKFLLNQGASVDEESYQHVWDYAYRKKCSLAELSELRCITMNPPSSYICKDWVEEQRFPQIHNIVLGRCTKLLRTEIDDNPEAVCITDATNRTALDWATALAKLPDMRLLIERGSPLNTMDVSGRTAVLHAVDSHNDDVLRTVLEAGADPNPELPEGLFRSSPLTAATFGGRIGMMKLLLEHGAKVDACNPEGRTALHTVASMQNVECAEILLTYGADIGCISSNGHSPLTTAVIYNNHAVLKLFIDRCATSRLDRLQLLPMIAEAADAKTMSILATSDLLRQTLNEDNFAACRETLRSRTDYHEALGDAFENLCLQLPCGQRTTASTVNSSE